MSAPEFVYVSYIRTTPELLYRALTERVFMERYWGVVVQSDWQVGSPITWERNGTRQSDPRQVVHEADPPRRLSYTWHAITPEWSRHSLDDERLRRAATEPLSRVTFEIEPHGELVKLTVRHDHFEPDSVVAQMVSQGWPLVVSSLKTLLETGETQPAAPSPALGIRPMELADFDARIAYFHGATDEHLDRLGVDRARLPAPESWRAAFADNLARALEQRTEYGVVWELGGTLVGFSTVDQIRIGEEAHMHLHIADPERRASGLGTQFVRLTAAHVCEVLALQRLYCEPNAFNVAPNRTLQKAGFRYVCSRQCRPAPINTYQATTIWVYSPPGFS